MSQTLKRGYNLSSLALSTARRLPCSRIRFSGPSPLSLFQRDHQERDGSRRDAGDARGLAERYGPHLLQLLPHLGAEPGHGIVIQIPRDVPLLQRGEAFHLLKLALNVSFVLHLDLDLLCSAGSSGRRRS